MYILYTVRSTSRYHAEVRLSESLPKIEKNPKIKSTQPQQISGRPRLVDRTVLMYVSKRIGLF